MKKYFLVLVFVFLFYLNNAQAITVDYARENANDCTAINSGYVLGEPDGQQAMLRNELPVYPGDTQPDVKYDLFWIWLRRFSGI